MADKPPFRYQEADESAGFLLWKMGGLWQQKIAEVLAPLGITQTQYAILASLRWFEAQREPNTQAHLAQHAKIEKMTLSKAIRRLEEQGIVLREGAPDDLRALHVSLTPAGRRLVERAVRAVEQADEDFFAVLGPRNLDQCKRFMRTLIAGNAARPLEE
jgi:DNA-binding MarR family transcriptional regulator